MIIKNGMIVTESEVFTGDILIREGIIADTGRNLEAANEEVIDAAGKYVLPGGIDVHTHFHLDVGVAISSDDFRSGTIAAACGGTTSIVDHIGQGPKGERLADPVNRYHELAAGQAVIDYGFHGVIPYEINDEELQEMELLTSEGISSFKIYMTYGQMVGDSDALRILKQAGACGAVIAVHPENHELVNYLRAYYSAQGMTTPIYHAKSRPEECEAEAVNRILTIAHMAGDAPVYIVHLSSGLALQYVRQARARGQQNIYAETCPQYLVLDESKYEEPGYEGLKYVLSPPIRKKYNQELLWQGIQEDEIQVIATDHCPFWYEKEKIPMGKDDFTKCPNGAPGVEARMALMFSEGVTKGRISVEKFAAVTSTNPARIYGMYPKKGTLKVGSDADIVLFDPEKEVTITKEILHERVDYTPYEGITVKGYPVMTIVRGKVVARDNCFVGEEGYGEFIKRTCM